MTPVLREDEEFVINSVAKAFSGTWTSGENPPDAYLTIGKNIIAVEISTLAEHVTGGRGTHSRFSDDAATAALANDLVAELQHLIPEGHTIYLVLSSPLLKLRQTKAALSEMLRNSLSDSEFFTTATEIEIHGNPIAISRNHHGEAHCKKLVAMFPHRHSNPDILSNTWQILEDRINVKAKKCAALVGRKPLWLALFDDYWLTDAHAYKYALSSFSPMHSFEKILVVDGHRRVDFNF